MEKEKILVTGAAGFIGAAVANKFLSLGYDVFTIDNLSTGFVSNIPTGVTFIKGNIQDESVVAQLGDNQFLAIVHIAGQSSGEISFDDPVYDLQTNTQSTLLLLKLALHTGCKNFIYASTMSVYGDQPDGAVDEDAPTFPKSFYAVGKLASEKYLQIYQQYGINCIALRLFNVYGPGQNMENLRQGMVSIFLSQAMQTGKITVKGATNRYRDMVYIDDVVNAFLLAFQKGQPGYHCYNVCTSEKTTVQQVIDTIAINLDQQVSTEISIGTPGDIFGIFGSNRKLKSALGWEPSVRFEDGMKKMVGWAKNSGNN